MGCRLAYCVEVTAVTAGWLLKPPASCSPSSGDSTTWKVRHKSTIDSTFNSIHNRALIPTNLAKNDAVMSQLTANDLKTRGVAAIESLLATQPEAMISVRGKERFVVMDVAHYHYLRECELDAALAQSRADVSAGRFVVESAKAHMDRLEAMLGADGEVASAKAAVPKKRPTEFKAIKASAAKVTSAKAMRRKSAA